MSDFEIISKLFSEEDKADIKGYLIYLLKSEIKEAFDDGWVFPVDRFKDFMDELLEDVEQEIKDEYKNEIKKGFEHGGLMLKINFDHEPKADVVEVVRCKECKYRKFVDWGMGDCVHPKGSKHIAYDYHYCSYGERREDDGL